MLRFLDCTSSILAQMNGRQLARSIAASEGRVIAAETIGVTQPLLNEISNAELAAAMSADLIILNIFDVDKPKILGLPFDADQKDAVRIVKELTGRPVGINLEPVAAVPAAQVPEMWAMTEGRRATVENGRKALEMGVDFIILTGNPGTGVTNAAIEETLRAYRAEFGDKFMLIAGKMHASGVLSEAGEKIITAEDVDAFLAAGADVVLMPAPGTVPGITTEYIRSLVVRAHEKGGLAMTAIGTSQEGADIATIRELALMCKMTGADIHHLGDSGYCGMALPENILEYSKAIRGVRHTYRRMAASIKR